MGYLKYDRNGYIKPQATVWGVVSERFDTGCFSWQDIAFALKSLGAIITNNDRPTHRREITHKQLRAVLNRNSFKAEELPANVWASAPRLQKLGTGWYTWHTPEQLAARRAMQQ